MVASRAPAPTCEHHEAGAHAEQCRYERLHIGTSPSDRLNGESDEKDRQCYARCLVHGLTLDCIVGLMPKLSCEGIIKRARNASTFNGLLVSFSIR